MERISDFKPLAKVVLPDVGEIPCAELTLVVGPNSSGKTQFLADLYSRLCGEPRDVVVASDVQLNKPEYARFMELLETEGYIRTTIDPGNNQRQIVPRTTYVGTGNAFQPLTHDQAQSWYHAYDGALASGRSNEFLNRIGRLLVTKLSLERRLVGLQSTTVIDFESQPPVVDLHAFHVNDAARRQLADEIIDAFGRAIWSDTTRGPTICLRVCEGDLPSADDRLSFEKMSKYRTIENEGDGLKSYVMICVSLLLGQRPVCLIDEPEMCLHPPQAYSLGKFIGRHGSSADVATFVATHSSQILRGVVQSTKRVEIIRLTQSRGQFHARRIPAHELVAVLEKPTLRAESVLDGIFSEAVVVVEADGDRLVYHTTWETLGKELRLDVHFAAVGGTGGVADTCRLYRTLHIPVVVVADLDLIADLNLLRRVLEAMAGKQMAESLVGKAKAAREQIRQLPPDVDPETCMRRIEEIGTMQMDWQRGDDAAIRRKLDGLSQDLNRMRRLKSGGLSCFPQAVGGPLKELVEALKGAGVFLAPVGELEGWLASEGIKSSKTNKAAWANEAAAKVQSKGPVSGDIWDFVRQVGRYLEDRKLGDI